MVSGVDNPNLVPVEDLPLPPGQLPAEKPGWQTTEFWLTLIALIVGAAMSSGAVQEGTTLYQALSFGAVVLTALGYTVSRAIVKSAKSNAEAQQASAYRMAMQAQRFRQN